MVGAKDSTFDPTAVQTMADALDEAWAILEANGDASRHQPQETRLALAKRIITLAAEHHYDAATLRDAALAGVALPQTSAAQH